METTIFSISVDKNVKETAEALFTRLGTDINAAVNMFLVQAIQENRIPFKVSLTSDNSNSIEYTDDEMFEEISETLIKKNSEAYKELAK